MMCKPAGGANKGWCTTDTDCKCHAMGATCSANYCTFTTPPASGSAGAAGSGAGGSTGTAGSGTDGGTMPASSSSGCSVASSTSGGFGALVGLALVAGRLVRRRRRA
ncbi:MAG TPA: MYXO-CTERM sorting domain-containing protein [Polyangia bacterium]|nr:MYXO-CTERM sorting domain-containing protein [Polyangia bacterium]